MRIALIGAVESTRVALEEVHNHGGGPALLFTLPLERRGRHSDYVDMRPLAEGLGIPLVETVNVNAEDTLDRLRHAEPDLVMVIGWSQICRQNFLQVAGIGSIGYHPAPLPRDRGRAVVPWTIIAGRQNTGSTLFWLDEGMDSGDILEQVVFPVDAEETAASLYQKHMEALRGMLRSVLPRLMAGETPRRPQDHSAATYCAKRTPADGLLDWGAPAKEVWTLIRGAGKPYPGAFTFRGGSRLVVWSAEYVGEAPYLGVPGQVQRLDGDGALIVCGDGRHVLISEVEMNGAGLMHPSEILRLHDRLGVDWLGIASVERSGP